MPDQIAKILAQAGATVEETAQFLNLTPKSVYEAIKRGDIPATRIGPKTLRVPTSWLRSVLAVEA
jgi:excisionase family DNA binding protein